MNTPSSRLWKPTIGFSSYTFLYELYHLYMMKQRLTRKQRNLTLHLNTPAIGKKTYPSKKKDPRISSKNRRQRAVISQIFSHSSKQQSIKTKLKQEVRKKHLVHLEKKTLTYKKTKSKVIKTPHQLRKEQNMNTLSMILCMMHCLH